MKSSRIRKEKEAPTQERCRRYGDWTEKAQEVGDKVDANDKTAVEADLNELKDLIAKSNPEEMTESQVAEIKAAKEKLMESAQKVFAKMYEQQARTKPWSSSGRS